MRRLISVIVPLALLLSGCGHDEAKQDNVALFLFDSSASCIAQREQYRREFRQKLMQMEGAQVYVDLIGANRVPEYPVSFEMPRRKGALSQYSEDFDRQRARIADAADAELQGLFRQHDEAVKEAQKDRADAAADTNIVLTLSIAANLFQRDGIRDLTHKELVVFSDGIQQSPELDLVSPKLDLENLSKTVAELERQGLVPSLSKVSVNFGGLAAGKGKDLSASRIILIRRFWQLYFERTEARFNPASLDGSVID